MICGTCKKEKPDHEFTKVNISRDGTKGLCKGCKSKRDEASYKKAKEADSSLPFFELIPDLLERPKARIAVLNLQKFTDRNNTSGIQSSDMLNMGLRAILKELKEPYDYCDARFMNEYEFVLISLTSVMDVENLIYTFEAFAPKSVRPKVIVGGFGVININLILPYIDIACFGRGEGQINGIIAGMRFDNVWRKEDDPCLEGRYVIRQAQYLVDGECGVGCRNHCAFCQYTHVRKAMNANELYHHGKGTPTVESEWAALAVDKPGCYTSAWDGWSEETRRRVHKPVTNEMIMDKLISIGSSGLGGGVNLKIFQIVGYPWETEASVLNDIKCTEAMLQRVDRSIKSRMVLSFLNTPFGPEPMTPMQYEPANISVSWQGVLGSRRVYEGKNLTAVMLPSISGAFTLLKRVYINRAAADQLDAFKRLAFNSRLRRMTDANKVAWLLKHDAVDKSMFGRVERAAFDYLSVGPARSG